jgi:cellulose synthase (UDP-forming)
MNGTEPFLVPIMSWRQRLTFGVLTVSWVAALVFFWSWWLHGNHVVTLFGMAVNTTMLVWTLLFPGIFFFHLARMKRANPALEIPALRVAMVVTKAPSEPWEVVRRTLRATLRQDMPFPYDVWLADESPTAEVLQWCEANQVLVSTREGREDYHRSEWPRRTRCKEGNLAFFYDTWGYRDYDVVAQFDADHRPSTNYLREAVRPFADPQVGYVAAPSICDANAKASWAARGRLYKEASLHGPQQAGSYLGIPPVCIGSHYTVRTAALQEIGGVGPELAEDFSTSLMMNSFGWQGVFALDAEAHGDGPETFADCMTQEFQWARSLSNVALLYNRRFWSGLSASAKIKLGYGELWYPLYALFMLFASAFPIIALVTHTPWVNVQLLSFWEHVCVVSIVLFIVVAWVARQGWLRPYDAPLLSWETGLFLLTRWPWVLAGLIQSVAGWVLHRRFDFKITPKGIEDAPPIALRTVVPYLLIAGACATTAIVQGDPGRAVGYYYFCLLNAVIYTIVAGAVVGLHLHENQSLRVSGAWRLARGPLVWTISVGCLTAAAVSLRGPEALRVILSPLAGTGLTHHLPYAPGLFAPPPPLAPMIVRAPTWLVLLTGIALVIAMLVSGAERRDGSLAGVISREAQNFERLLVAVIFASGIAYVFLALEWRHGRAITAAGFSAVLVASLLLIGASLIRTERPNRLAVSPLIPGDDGARGPEKNRGIVLQPVFAVSPLDALAAQLEAQPVPRRVPAASGGGPVWLLEQFALRSARFSRRAEVFEVPLHTDVTEAEIVWDLNDGGRFTLAPLDPRRSGSDRAQTGAVDTAHVAALRTAESSRAHALLYDSLVLDGWEPSGQGDRWYAHRFERRRSGENHG